jgi:hypothetical protein
VTKRRRGEPLTPAERSLRARMAVHTSWAHTTDRAARTAPARRAALQRFERQVDPDGTLNPAERRRRAEQAMRAPTWPGSPYDPRKYAGGRRHRDACPPMSTGQDRSESKRRPELLGHRA